MAATLTHAVADEVTTNTTSYTSTAFTPTAGDLLVVLVSASDTTAAGSVSNSQGLTFTKVTSALKNGGLDTMYVFVANAACNGNSQTCTFDCTGDAATGCAMSIVRISGMSKFGSSAVRQTAKQENQAAATPAPAFSSAPLTTNPCIALMANLTNPATMTRPDNNWTEQRDNGFNTPTNGYEYCTRASGFTGTTITWGSASASAFGAIIVEFDNSVSGTLAATESGSDTGAATGTVLVKGTLAGTESGADTAAAAGNVLISGALAASETGSDTAASAGQVLVRGSLAGSESGADIAAAAGVVLVSGALAASETGDDTAAIAGVVKVSGALVAAEAGDDVAALAGAVLVSGQVAAVEQGEDVAAFVGSAALEGIGGTMDAFEEGADTASIAGELGAPVEPPAVGGANVTRKKRRPPETPMVVQYYAAHPPPRPSPAEVARRRESREEIAILLAVGAL